MPEDKVIKSGQFTLGRVLFLAACGIVLFVIVAKGFLIYGYLLLTLVLCVLLFLIATDYGVDLDKVDFTASPTPAGPVSCRALRKPRVSPLRAREIPRSSARPPGRGNAEGKRRHSASSASAIDSSTSSEPCQGRNRMKDRWTTAQGSPLRKPCR